MLKILDTNELKQADEKSLEKQNISSFQLMERAAFAVLGRMLLKDSFLAERNDFVLFCGMGNNGGDGLALARMLLERGKNVQIYFVKHKGKGSPDFERNFQLLKKCKPDIKILDERNSDFDLSENSLVLDCILGSGLSRPLEGLLKTVVQKINSLPNRVVAIDAPCGFFMENNSANDMSSIVQADYTYTIGLPKLSFFFPDSYVFVGDWEVVPIGLDKDFIQSRKSDYFYLQPSDAQGILKKREAFSHKGSFGHVLLVAGSYGKIGAAVLAASACLRAGTGLLSVLAPKCGYEILQAKVPEAMVIASRGEKELQDFEHKLDYSTIGLGPGIGTSEGTANFLYNCLTSYSKPMVLDADALNIIARNKNHLKNIPANSLLTPHPAEFKRLVGPWKNDFERLKLLREFSAKNKVFVILKGKFSNLACPSGKVFFNCSGNPGMSSAGSGDVLTGILTALLAQGYQVEKAAILGMYLHGLAGDLAAAKKTQHSMIAGDIVEAIPDAYQKIIDMEWD